MISPVKSPQTYLGAERRLPIRLALQTANVLKRCGLPEPEFTVDSVIRSAQRMAGLTDFGGDESFREPMKILLEDYAAETRYGYLGRCMARQRCVGLASNRLLIQDELRRFPEIREERITRPLFVLGLPRTGTTLLNNLLAQDPNCRPLLTWEAFGPSISAKEEKRRVDPRIQRAKWLVWAIYYAAPQMRAAHPMDPLGPEECLGLLASTFVSVFLAEGPRYRDWLMTLGREETSAAYRHYKQQLQALQRRRSGEHWILKSPAHLYAIDGLIDVFPDACIVQTHRDPIEVVPSGCSMSAMVQGILYENFDLHQFGAYYVETLLKCLDRSAKARDSIAPERFFDLQFEELMQDPLGCVHRIYEHFGYELSAEMETRMQRLMKENPRHKHGVHRYDLTQFGLQADAIRREFAPYCERFQIQTAK